MFIRLVVALALLAVGAGCSPRTTLRDTQTIHDAAATRIWIIQGTGEDQFVVLCDVAMQVQTRQLCTKWPSPQLAPPPPLPPP